MRLYPSLSPLLRRSLRFGGNSERGHSTAGKFLGYRFGDDQVPLNVWMAIYWEVILFGIGYRAKVRQNVDICSAMAYDEGAQVIVHLVGVEADWPFSHGNHCRTRPLRQQDRYQGHTRSIRFRCNISGLAAEPLQVALPLLIRRGH